MMLGNHCPHERVLRLHAQIDYKLRLGYKRVPLRMLFESQECYA